MAPLLCSSAPGRGTTPFERLHVRELLLDPPEGSATTVEELSKLAPAVGEDGSLEFFSAAAPVDLVDQNELRIKPGTLGMHMFGISERATRSKTLLERTVSESHSVAYAQKPNELKLHRSRFLCHACGKN